MIDVAIHDPISQYIPHPPASIATTTPNQPLSASFGGFDLTGEQSSSCVNLFDIQNWSFIAAMTFHQLDQVHHHQQQQQQQQQQQNPSSSHQQQQQNSRHYDMTTAFPNQYDTSVQQTAMLQQPSLGPPFVEPSNNYIALPSTTTTTYGGYPSTTTQSITLDNNNNVGINYPRNAYSTQQQQSQQHHHHLNQLIAGYNFPQNNCLHQRDSIYQTTIPSSIGQQHHHHINHQKSIPSTISSNYSRQDNTANLPINIAPNTIAPNLYLPQFNNQSTSNPSTMLLPLFDSFTTKPTSTPTISISQNSSVSSTETSPTKQTYSYSGPPKSYYSRLPLYDRPFKCDQCPQSFNRNHDLKRHKRIHLAVKPYPCQYCDKQFSRKDALKRHILVKGCNKGSTTVDRINGNNTSNNKTSDIKNNNNNKVDESSISSTNYVDENAIKSEPSLGMSI